MEHNTGNLGEIDNNINTNFNANRLSRANNTNIKYNTSKLNGTDNNININLNIDGLSRVNKNINMKYDMSKANKILNAKKSKDVRI